VFYTAGWGQVLLAGGPLAGVIVTQTGNFFVKCVDTRIKRGDRQHERASAYEERVWEAKSEALKRLISACRFVKLQAQPVDSDERIPDKAARRRGVTIRALDLFKGRVGDEDGISEVTAYAAQPVRAGLEEVLEVVDVQLRTHRDQLARLRIIGTQLRGVVRQPVTDDSGSELAQATQFFQQHADLWRERGEVLDAIGAASALDVSDVIALCDQVIDAASKDLRGGYTE
jgi:hypothetical protein